MHTKRVNNLNFVESPANLELKEPFDYEVIRIQNQKEFQMPSTVALTTTLKLE